jgi:hypothetical protein
MRISETVSDAYEEVSNNFEFVQENRILYITNKNSLL